MATLRFLGACGTVTGSKFLLEAGSRRVLFDCGVFQGPSDLKQKNWSPPDFDPGSLDAVVLTHAHIDHTGYLPRLGKLGYGGPVYVTPPTAGLLEYLLPDAAHLHEEDARYANRKGYSSHRPALPFFDSDEARRALGLLRPVAFHERAELAPGVAFTFRRVGHILGAAFIEVEADGRRLVFSGDVGQRGVPILKDPETPDSADYLLLESTYGDRLHPAGSPREELGRVVAEVVVKRGVLLIPAFAVGRAQDVLYHLRSLQREGAIPADLPIYVDSPMAVSAVDLYCSALSEHDLEMAKLQSEGDCPISGPSVHLVRDRIESKALNERRGPMIIISASGMLSGGRILHHLKRRLPDPETTLLFVGFQAEGTLGRRILEGAHEVRIHGETVTVRAEIRDVPALSAHADQRGLVEWSGALAAAPRAVYLVHGEPKAREALAAALRSKPGWNVVLPEEGQAVELQ
ncbi:MAG TPA: MBL fold metallo-hydrolase [Thermoanaerobaculia bacterium]|nr:MBL fold metallo-hydrolase [Thermoanaerobaculia bacterium]